MKRKTWVAAAAVAVAGWTAPAASAELVYGITESDKLVSLSSFAPGGNPVNAVALTGLANGETIKAIDVRPATLQLYGLANTGQLYRINTVSGAVTAIGAPLSLTGTNFDIDFNPNVDRLRVVSDGEQNLRVQINADGSSVNSTPDTALTPAGNVTGAAYTRNAPLPGSTTTLFDIDTGSDKLVKQDPPNAGTLTDVGALGVDLNGDAGLDISTTSAADGTVGTDTAFMLARFPDSSDRLYTVNLTSGAATSLGDIAGDPVRDIAVAAPIPQLAVVYTPGLLGSQRLVTVRADLPGTVGPTQTITGLQNGETIVGIDRRPANGLVYAVGSSSRLYTLDLATGVATPVAATPFTTALDGTSFGIDFNPVPDRLRSLSNNEQNLRINPIDATVTQDTSLTPAGEVTGAAYTNPVAGATSTTLFDIDSGTDMLYTQGTNVMPADPNNGVLTAVGPLGVNAAADNGFDIVARFNQQFAALNPMGVPEPPALYTLNGFTPAVAPNDGRSALVGTLGGLPDNLAEVAGMTIVSDNVLPVPTPTATATPTATVTTTPTVTVTPTPTEKKAPKLSAKVKPKRDKTAPFEVRVKGKVKPPAGVNSAKACKGKVRVVITRKGKKLGGGKAPVSSSCAFTIKRTLSKKAGNKGSAKVQIRFGGNAVLLPKAITRRFAYGS